MIFIEQFKRYNFKHKLRRRTIFVVFLLSEWLTTRKAIKTRILQFSAKVLALFTEYTLWVAFGWVSSSALDVCAYLASPLPWRKIEQVNMRDPLCKVAATCTELQYDSNSHISNSKNQFRLSPTHSTSKRYTCCIYKSSLVVIGFNFKKNYFQ